jgi:hypothetical protein
MRAMPARAPTLAWLLTALTCFLAGLAVGEVRNQDSGPPVVVVATVAPTAAPTATPVPTPTQTPPPTPTATPRPTPRPSS